ncbi:MAG: BLUF domain protein [Cytophagaceae bacterium]|nr:MAG: BLUF domain protein [Cytophagaceae bacterium]
MDSCIVYFGRAVEPFEPQLAPILEQSRHWNAEHNITGALLYVRGNVIQVLEGEQQVIESLFQRIEADTRHGQVERILTRPITQRLFSEWSMGYVTINHSQLEEIRAAFPLEAAEVTAAVEPLVLRIIRTFYEANRYDQMKALQ